MMMMKKRKKNKTKEPWIKHKTTGLKRSEWPLVLVVVDDEGGVPKCWRLD